MDNDLLACFNEEMQQSEVPKGITTLTVTNVVFNSGEGKKQCK